MTFREELHMKWKQVMAVCVYKSKRFEGCPVEETWKTFEGFYADNHLRYLRAKNKWKNYKRVTEANVNSKISLNKIQIVRKVKERGFTKKNTVFTSASDRMKYHVTANIIMFDDKRLGTRDFKNILEKKGIKRSMGNICVRQIKNKDLFENNRLDKWEWKGGNYSLIDIAEIENVNYGLLRYKVCTDKFDLQKAIKHCRIYKPSLYEFEGKLIAPNKIFKILSERHNISISIIRSRFYDWGYNIEKLIIEKSENIHAPYPKKTIVVKDEKKHEFNTLTAAANFIGISSGMASSYANGNRKKKYKGYDIYYAEQSE